MCVVKPTIGYSVAKHGNVVFHATHCGTCSVIPLRSYSGHLGSGGDKYYCVIERHAGTDNFSGWLIAQVAYDATTPPMIPVNDYMFEISGSIGNDNAIRGVANKIQSEGEIVGSYSIFGDIDNNSSRLIINGIFTKDALILDTPLLLPLQKPQYQGEQS